MIAVYVPLLLIAALLLPLRIDEWLQLLGSHTPGKFLYYLPQQPGSAPLAYFVQFPFVLALGISRLGARLPSLLFALGSCYLFLRLAQAIPLRRPYLALLAFALLPSQYRFATTALPFEQALFFLLLATLIFLRLLRAPGVKLAVWYGLALTACIYTARFSYLPALGYLLFLFAFVNRARERRSIWFLLAPTLTAPLLFLPYYLWARPQANPRWLYAPLAPGAPSSVYLQLFHDLTGGGLPAYALALLLIAGLFAALWKLFGVPLAALDRSIAIFSLFGGVVTSLAVVIVLDVWNGYSFSSDQALWAIPGAILCSFAALDWIAQPKKRRLWSYALPLSLIALSIVGDIDYLVTPTDNLRVEAEQLSPLLAGDSCVVFVSEGLSKYLFLMLQPALESRVCYNFFHQRAVLASHAYVRPQQQQNAESFFRGLNFTEVKRLHIGGGQIIVVENTGR